MLKVRPDTKSGGGGGGGGLYASARSLLPFDVLRLIKYKSIIFNNVSTYGRGGGGGLKHSEHPPPPPWIRHWGLHAKYFLASLEILGNRNFQKASGSIGEV